MLEWAHRWGNSGVGGRRVKFFQEDRDPQKAVPFGVTETVSHLVAWWGVSGLAALLVPAFRSMYDDFGVELPVVTRLLFWLPELMREHWLLTAVVLVLIGLADAGIGRCVARSESPELQKAWHWLMLSIPVLFLIGCGLALLAPIPQIIIHLSAP